MRVRSIVDPVTYGASDWETFRGLVREYEQFLGSAPTLDFFTFRYEARARLARLFFEGTRMPGLHEIEAGTASDETEEGRDASLLDASESSAWFRTWSANYEALGRYLGDRDTFYVVLEHTQPETAESSLSDSLSDVLSDLQEGAILWDDGRIEEAKWEWVFRFDHWGEHALDAMYALHWRVDWDGNGAGV